MGRLGHGRSASLLSVAAAYAATRFNNIMDMLQLVFAFVNAPLFATFLLGMFWRRATGHGAFFGLLSGTLAAAVHHGLTLPHGRGAGHQGRLAGHRCHTLPERDGAELLDRDLGVDRLLRGDHCDLAGDDAPQDRRRAPRAGYSLTPRIRTAISRGTSGPATLGMAVLALTLVLNIVFW